MHRRNFSRFNNDEQGSTVVEFVMVATLFFMVLIGIMEFGRLLYTHNALTDAARRGARYASINKQASLNCVRNVIIYGENHIDKANACAPQSGATPLVNHLDTATINIVYQGANIDPDPEIDTSYGTNLGTVTVSIEDYEFTLMIPLVTLQLTLDDYTTTATAESAGEEPSAIVVP